VNIYFHEIYFKSKNAFQTQFLTQNRVNHYPQAIEATIEAAKIPGVTPTYTVVFPHRPAHSETETFCVIYLPETKFQDTATRVNSSTSISKTVVKHCGARPYKIIPLDENTLQKSSLGKLSRSKLRKSFEEGKYSEHIKANEEIIANYKGHIYEPATTGTSSGRLLCCCCPFGTLCPMI
jgi:hypothetical protein